MTEKTAYQWDFDGSCAPNRGARWNETFSVGIFQWIPKSSGKGLKRGKVVKRIRGHVSCPDVVYNEARKYIEHLEKLKAAHRGTFNKISR